MNAQADAEMASPVQSATVAECCALAVGATGKASTFAELAQPISASAVHKQGVRRRPSLVATATALSRLVGNLRGVAKTPSLGMLSAGQSSETLRLR